MRILAIDPGALRLGYSVIEDGVLIDSGIKGLVRKPEEEFQAYRFRLIRYWIKEFPLLLNLVNPDIIYSETIPAVGSGSFIAATQSELVKAAITTCQVIAFQRDIDWTQLAATTIKKDLTGSGRASKVKVRDAVISAFPQLKERKKELTTYADESDAIGIGIVAMKRNGKTRS